jgi:predicted RNA-binding Zn ribbon-like protein
MPSEEPKPRLSLAIAAANTVYAVRGELTDGVAEVAGLRAWTEARLESVSGAQSMLPEQITEADLGSFHRLREALRALLHAAAAGELGDAWAIAALNESAARGPRSSVLRQSDGRYRVDQRAAPPLGVAAVAAIAEDAIALLGSARVAQVRRCAAPGCVQFFLAEDPRRRWCSPSCGNRARVARHYRRHREGAAPP